MGGASPRFGVMHDFRQALPWRLPVAEYYAECLALVEEAEALGYEFVWLSEHHGTADGFLPSPLVAAATIAARTSRIGTNVLLLPLHHPVRVAEDAAVADALSGGRLIRGVGQGYAHHEFELLEVHRRHRPSRFEEAFLVIRQALREGRTGFAGRRFRIPEGAFTPERDVPIHVGATGGPALDRAVRLGDGLLAYVAEPKHAAARYSDYRAGEVARTPVRVASCLPIWSTSSPYARRTASACCSTGCRSAWQPGSGSAWSGRTGPARRRSCPCSPARCRPTPAG